jgi:S1-C subfamily serine protease
MWAQYQRPNPEVPKAEASAIEASRKGAGPRAVSARGPLLPAEQSLVRAFREAKTSVVYINAATNQRLLNIVTGDVFALPAGTGTGFVWDHLGHVVTNYHVVTIDLPPDQKNGLPRTVEAEKVQVTLSNGKTYEARVVARSLVHDIAVLKVFAPFAEMKAIPIGRSSDLQVGQTVMAIGNPFGLDHTLTTGVVSALGREIQSQIANTFYGRKMRGMIQTDAAINPGNSGGPLLDSAGRLIGMSTAIFVRQDLSTSSGVGFAIPVDTLNSVVPRLIAHGQIRPLGFDVVTATPVSAARAGIKEGLLVLDVLKGSSADLAGLLPSKISPEGLLLELGDILLRYKGKRIENDLWLLDQLELENPDAPLEFDVLRQGAVVKVVIPREAQPKSKGPEI